MAKCRTVVSSIILALAITATARADDDLALTWRAPPSCPAREDVVRRIGEIAKSRTGSATPGRSIQVAIEAGPPWRAEIVVEGAERGERHLEASTCEALTQAVALVVALAIDRPLG